MTRIHTHLGLRRSLAVVDTAGLMLDLGTAVCSAEDGVGELFQRLFSPEPPAQTGQPAQAPMQAPTARRGRTAALQPYYGRHYARRAESTRRPSIRYASLPKPKVEPLKIRISDRQLPLDMSAGAGAALLRDRTLRPGDIVVLESGARVFTGSTAKPHAVKDFESIGRSAFVDRHTRTLLTTMLVPVGAMTAAEAQRRMAAMKGLPSLATTPALLQTAGIRVIYPGGTAP